MTRLVLSLLTAALLCTASAPESLAAQGQGRGATRSSAKPAVTTPININTASASDLEALPGVGARTAARIVEYRQKNGSFKKVEELMNVKGLGEKNFVKLKGQITVGAAKAGDHPQPPQL